MKNDSRIVNPLAQRVRTMLPTPEAPFWSKSGEPVRTQHGKHDPNTYVFGLGYHAAMELQYIRSGTGFYFIAGRFCPFQAHSLVIILPNESHGLMLPAGGPLVRKTMLQLNLKRMHARPNPDWPRTLLLIESEASDVELVLSQMDKELRHKRHGWETMLQLQQKLLFALLERIAQRGNPEPNEQPLVSQLSTLIEARFSEPLTVAGICRHFGYSVNYLPKLFKQITGIGLKQYLLHRRIMEAKRLLETQPALTVNAIAEQVGFQEIVTFYRAFKMIAGVVPETYRRLFK